jgi:hypothetical protein
MKALMWWFALGFVLGGAYFADPWVGIGTGLGLYLVTVQLWPLATCWYCDGEKKTGFDPMDGDNFRVCPVCDGSGKTKRVCALWDGSWR